MEYFFALTDSKKAMKFETSDGKEYDIDKSVWERWETITQMLTACGYHEQCKAASQAGGPPPESLIRTPLLVVSAYVLDLVLVFAQAEKDHNITTWPPAKKDDYDIWRGQPSTGYEADYAASLSEVDLFRVYMAADFLDHKHLMDVCARQLAVFARDGTDKYAKILAEIRAAGQNIPSHLEMSETPE
jgi:hypothetical protein